MRPGSRETVRVLDRSIRRPSYPGLRQVGLLTLIMSVLASCGGESGDGGNAASTAKSSTRTVMTYTSPPPRSSAPRPQRVRQAPILGVGETHRLEALGGGVGPVDVAVTRVISPLPLSSVEQRFFGTNRFVAIELSFANRGTKTFDASLATYSRLFTSDDSVVDPASFSFTHCQNPTLRAPIIAAGRGGRGCIAFMVSRGAKPRTFQYNRLWFVTPDRSYVKWDLRGR